MVRLKPRFILRIDFLIIDLELNGHPAKYKRWNNYKKAESLG